MAMIEIEQASMTCEEAKLAGERNLQRTKRAHEDVRPEEEVREAPREAAVFLRGESEVSGAKNVYRRSERTWR